MSVLPRPDGSVGVVAPLLGVLIPEIVGGGGR